jgi:hypothetical protein
MLRRLLALTGVALSLVTVLQVGSGGQLVPVAAVDSVANSEAEATAGFILPPVSADAEPSQARETHELDEAIGDRKHFQRFVREALLQLERGECDLATAADRVFYFCLHHNPRYLEYVATYESGKTIRLQVAQNLIRDFLDRKGRAGAGPALDAVIARLQLEYAHLPGAEAFAAQPDLQ